jgi:predicted phosphodiesterase
MGLVMKNIRIVCAADLHLGRRLVRLPEGLEEFSHAPKDAWRSLVQFVCDPVNRVDALVLAGDIFDNEQDLYEAIGVFEEGVGRILAKQIPILTVAGNHDARALKRCHRRMDHPLFYFLGENEMWQSQVLTLHGRKIGFVGWSFSSQKCEVNPFKSFTGCEAALTLGILHCDLFSAKTSCYAPVELKNFHPLPVKAWILGHIHIPEILLRDPLVFYCGSLQGLDPSEHGVRGCRLLEISPSGEMRHQFISCTSLLWSSLSIDLSEMDGENFDETLCAFLRTHLQEIPHTVKAVLCRVALQGKSSFYRKIHQFAEKIKGRHFAQVGELGIPCYIEEVLIECSPDIDLKSLASGRDLAALTAQLICRVKDSEDGCSKLLAECAQYVQILAEKNGHIEMGNDVSLLEKELVSTGYEVLDMILMQEEGEHASFDS